MRAETGELWGTIHNGVWHWTNTNTYSGNIMMDKNAFQWDAYRPLVDRIPALTGGVCPGGAVCPGACLSRRGCLPGGCLSKGVSTQGVCVSQHAMGELSARGGGGAVCVSQLAMDICENITFADGKNEMVLIHA